MYFLKEKISTILKDLSKYRYPQSIEIKDYMLKEGNFKGGEMEDTALPGWVSFKPGQRWGGRDKHFWFRSAISIPSEFEGKTVVYTVKTGKEGQWDAQNPQFLIYVNGQIVQGLDVNHTEVTISDNAKSEDRYEIALYAYGGMIDELIELYSTISILDREVEKFYYDLKVPFDILSLLDENDKRRIDITGYLDNALNMTDLRKPFSNDFYNSVRKATEYLDNEFYGKYCGNDEIIAHCIGHTHIDVAWLWTLAQTQEKTVRSFSTVLNLMKQYPNYKFMSSQPQLYKFLKEKEPSVYEQLKERVKEGRWEPEGAMWLEADCNLSSGESLVRQILFGTRFFKDEFGIQNKILWLPDVFGYSAALPQILKKSGIQYFMTTKISWSEYNKMPYDTFMWKGIDGSEILTQFITTTDYDTPESNHTTTYVGHLKPTHIMGAWKRYQQKNLTNEVMVCYGFGDGGGGPTKDMLENSIRMEKGIPGCPKVHMGTSLEFFENLEKKVSGNSKLPKWVGELYLELHRGTYTTMASNKKFNRKSELLYQDAELLSVLTSALTGGSYPQEKINNGWETILLNQFHDILPGSSIKEVYEDSKKQYIEVLNNGNEIIEGAIDSIAGNISADEEIVAVFNQLGFERNDIASFTLPDEYDSITVYDGDNTPLNCQMADGKALFFAQNIPPKGYKTYKIQKNATNIHSEIIVEKSMLSNKFFDVKLDNGGNIISVYDKTTDREVLKQGEKANVLQAFEDKPRSWDAWDISIYYQDKMWTIEETENIEVIENGPVRGCLRVSKKFLDSVIVQDICIYSDIPRIDFKTRIDWKEKQIMLKAAFPVDVHDDKATYDVQFGNVERPTHWNTSWDYARFEVCAQKWADLSEDGYGVSLLNDCKYGHDIKDGVMRLTLLRSPIDPNAEADKEMHEFTYSLYPHNNDWKGAGTEKMAYSLNSPLYAVASKPHSGNLPKEFSFINIDKDNVVVETIKKAEDTDDIIIRVFECHNRRVKVNASYFKALTSVTECDLMENDINEISANGTSFSFEIKPYEIRTFKIR